MKLDTIASLIDKKADMLACLTNNVRRDIRDCLRRYGVLTVYDLSRHLNIPEANIYYHLDLMVKYGIVVKELKKINGRTIAEYRLSEEYNQLFSEQPVAPDLTPIHLLFLTYLGFTTISVLFGDFLLPLLKPFGIVTIGQLLVVGLVGLITTLLPITYYAIKFNLKLVGWFDSVRYWFVKVIRR